WPKSVQEVDLKTKQDYESELKKPISEQEINLVADENSEDASYRNGVDPPFGIDSQRYSSLTRMLRITAFAMRFVCRLRNKSIAKLAVN
ncbi:MAG: hypothetical protein JAZ03_24335, partial [Candidatus Thiodiazotropha taylori]|nr:hypothetical protein [Candidatus Thiodiazotropha taylori]MCW4337063.1 hypothetical protein [Candidatus Thiodiazotropha endolucinida]